MEHRKAKYTITPTMHALERLRKQQQLQRDREAKMTALRKDIAERREERFLERHGVTADDPRLPFIEKALLDAGMKGMDIRDDKVANEIATKTLKKLERRITREQTDIIYYVRCGDLIKLGTTNNLKRRMNAYPPNAELLATEVGSYQLEEQRISEFSEYLAGRREWFHQGPRLLAHIAALRVASPAA